MQIEPVSKGAIVGFKKRKARAQGGGENPEKKAAIEGPAEAKGVDEFDRPRTSRFKDEGDL